MCLFHSENLSPSTSTCMYVLPKQNWKTVVIQVVRFESQDRSLEAVRSHLKTTSIYKLKITRLMTNFQCNFVYLFLIQDIIVVQCGNIVIRSGFQFGTKWLEMWYEVTWDVVRSDWYEMVFGTKWPVTELTICQITCYVMHLYVVFQLLKSISRWLLQNTMHRHWNKQKKIWNLNMCPLYLITMSTVSKHNLLQ